MASKAAAGSTITFGTSTTSLSVTSISFSDNGQPIDVTNLASSTAVYTPGTPDLECRVEMLGVPTLTVGQTGAVSITWNDGGTDTISSALITSIETSGGVGEAIRSTVTFKPYGS